MARTRRRRGRGRGNGQGSSSNGRADGQQRGQGGGNGQRRRTNRGGSRSKRSRRPAGNGKQHGAAFWGDPERLPDPAMGLQVVEQPDAVVRSLGAPPLRNHESVAPNYFTLVYDHAVRTAGALATAGGLIDMDTLRDELDDIELEVPGDE